MTTINVRHGRRLTARYLLGDDLLRARATGATRNASSVTSVTPTVRDRARRVATRIAVPAAIPLVAVDAYQDPALWETAGGIAGTILAGRYALRTGRNVRHWRHRKVYVRPLAQVIGPSLGEPAHRPDAWLHVSPDLAGLAGRLVRPMSPAEEAIRKVYGARVAPVLMWAPERTMRAYWWAHGRTGTIRKGLDWFRVPTETRPSRVEITLRAGFATKDQRDLIRQAVAAKLGISDLIESWDQVGPVAVVTFTVRERPPASVGLDDIRPHLAGLAEHEFVIGLTTGRRPVIISLDDDAPHIACSAGSGAGKSVLAKVIGTQVLARGGEVIILDRKGSHRWAMGLDGVRYCTKPGDMHRVLCELSGEADDRNDQALREPEGWDPGRRRFIIFEEMNATVSQLLQWWESNRDKGDPKTSPGIVAFRNLMFMGRSAKMNLFGVAQMLTARTTGGPEARENFGVRCLARYTVNAWRMLVPECAMPKKSKTRGRWQIVVGGESTETQVAFLTDAEAREIANVPMSPVPRIPAMQGERTGTPVDGDLITLRDAWAKYCPSVDYETLKKRRTRARRTGGGPKVCAQRGRAELYDPDDLRRWITTESLTSTESSDV